MEKKEESVLFKLINPSHSPPPPSPPEQTDLSWRGVCGSKEAKKHYTVICFRGCGRGPALAVHWLGEGKDGQEE